MRPKICVLGDSELARVLRDRDYADVVDAGAGEDLSGAALVVVVGRAENLFDDIRDRAPAAVVVVAGDSPQPVCEATLFPRARILGVNGTDAAAEVADSVILDRQRVHECTVRLEGERGIEGEFAAAPVRVGAGGIAEIVEG